MHRPIGRGCSSLIARASMANRVIACRRHDSGRTTLPVYDDERRDQQRLHQRQDRPPVQRRGVEESEPLGAATSLHRGRLPDNSGSPADEQREPLDRNLDGARRRRSTSCRSSQAGRWKGYWRHPRAGQPQLKWIAGGRSSRKHSVRYRHAAIEPSYVSAFQRYLDQLSPSPLRHGCWYCRLPAPGIVQGT